MNSTRVLAIIAVSVSVVLCCGISSAAFLVRGLVGDPVHFEEEEPPRAMPAWAEAKNGLRLDVALITHLRLEHRMHPGEPEFATWPIAEGLVAVAQVDLDGGTWSVTRPDVRTWGVSEEIVFTTARDNTRAAHDWSTTTLDDGTIDFGGPDLEASLMTWPEKLDALPVRGDLIIGPGPTMLVAVGSEMTGALDLMIEGLEGLGDFLDLNDGQPRLDSLEGLWVRHDGAWHRWHPEPGSAREARYLPLREHIEDSGYSREMMLFAEARVIASDRQYTEGDQLSFIHFTEDTNYVFPPARFAVFIKSGKVVAAGPWSVTAPFIRPVPDTALPWFRATRFPTSEELTAIGIDPRFAD